MINKKLSIKSWRQRSQAHRTISNVKEVADDRVAVVRDLKTDSVITTQLLLPDDLKIQDSATADELNIQRLQFADQSLALEDLFICLLTYLHKDHYAFMIDDTRNVFHYTFSMSYQPQKQYQSALTHEE